MLSYFPPAPQTERPQSSLPVHTCHPDYSPTWADASWINRRNLLQDRRTWSTLHDGRVRPPRLWQFDGSCSRDRACNRGCSGRDGSAAASRENQPGVRLEKRAIEPKIAGRGVRNPGCRWTRDGAIEPNPPGPCSRGAEAGKRSPGGIARWRRGFSGRTTPILPVRLNPEFTVT